MQIILLRRVFFPFRSCCLQPSASGSCYYAAPEDGRACKTFGRFTGLLSASGSRQGNKKAVKAEDDSGLPFIFAK